MLRQDYYVYGHYRKSDGVIFYVGKGRAYRCFSRHKRSDWWNRIVAKHGILIRKFREGMSERCALSLEMALIHIYKPTLCNATNGGDGLSGYKFTKESLEKKSQKMRGRVASPETRAKQSALKKGIPLTGEHAENAAKTLKS